MALFHRSQLAQIQDEFRLSMRRLFSDLCRELYAHQADLARQFDLPIEFFDALRSALPLKTCAHWKVVGWIEALNDLVYFLDILQQWKIERGRSDFVAQLFDECQEKFFEHSYFDDLFPTGHPQVSGFEKRLIALCRRLAPELTQEALWLDPGLPAKWCRQQKRTHWEVSANLNANFERAELAGTISIGLTGAWVKGPQAVQRALLKSGGEAVFQVSPREVSLKIGKAVSSIWTAEEGHGQWQWVWQEPLTAVVEGEESVTVGPTLVYGKDRLPRTVKLTGHRAVERIARAWKTIEQAWPEGYDLLTLLTTRIVPLQAQGVVSFSYRHRPGLSFINCFHRDNLDLIDDLIHENSHHHLNLLLRKYVLYRGDRHQQIFYSPWRRSLRPLRGILHATFTFVMGAYLFERLSSWASGPGGAEKWKQAGLTQRDLQRARFRCLEEVEAVRYSLQDLHYADHHLGWLTSSGRRLVGELAQMIERVEHSSRWFRLEVEQSRFGPALRKHTKELQQARQTYGPMRLSQV